MICKLFHMTFVPYRAGSPVRQYNYGKHFKQRAFGLFMKQYETIFQNTLQLTPEILKFSIPLMGTGILQLLYNAADSVIVGRFAGSVSLAAVGSTTSLVYLFISLFNGVSVGVNYLAARFYGAGDDQGLSETVHCSSLLGLTLGVLAGLIGILFAPQCLELMHTDPEVLPYAVLYLRIYFLGVPALVLYNFGSALLRAVGDTVSTFLFMLISGAVNVALNLLLVIVLRMDVAGVAIATVVSQTLSAVLVFIRLALRNDGCRFMIRRIRYYSDKAGTMLSVGLTAGLQGTVFSIANVIIQAQVNTFGAAAMAGNVAASNLENFIHIILNAFYQAAITFTSRALGAEDLKCAKAVLVSTLGLNTAFGVVLCGALLVFRRPLLGIYIKPSDAAYAEVIATGIKRVFCIGQFQWVGGLMETASGSLRGYGKSMNSTVTTLIGSCALRVVWVYTVFRMIGTIESLYIAIPISWILTFLAHILFLRYYQKQLDYSTEGWNEAS